MQRGVSSELSKSLDGRQLRRSGDVLKPRRLSDRPGDLPGPLYVHGGVAPTMLSVLAFHPEGVQRYRDIKLQQLVELVASGCPLWVRLKGLGDPELLLQTLEMLEVPHELHAALLETPQRTRVDALGECQPPPASGELDDIFFFLVDEVLDEVLPLLEELADQLDNLEEASLRRPSPRVLHRAYEIRSTLRQVRAMIWPLRSQLIVLIRQSKRLLDRGAIRGFREVNTHVEVLFETAELLRHQCDGVTGTYMASISNRMNQVMKVLTIISSIFVPLTFIAGVYGMNFNPEKSPWNMPELDAYYGYPLSLAFMLVISLLQIYWLWKRGWFQDWTGTR